MEKTKSVTIVDKDNFDELMSVVESLTDTGLL